MELLARGHRCVRPRTQRAQRPRHCTYMQTRLRPPRPAGAASAAPAWPRVLLSPARFTCDLRALHPPGGSPSARGRVPAPPKCGPLSGAARAGRLRETGDPAPAAAGLWGDRLSHATCTRHCAHTPAVPAPSLGAETPFPDFSVPSGQRARPAGLGAERADGGRCRRAESRDPARRGRVHAGAARGACRPLMILLMSNTPSYLC